MADREVKLSAYFIKERTVVIMTLFETVGNIKVYTEQKKKHFSELKNQTIWNTLIDTKTEPTIK